MVPDEAIGKIADAAQEAMSKLDAFYASQGGDMKPLKHFTVEDHAWRSNYTAAQADAWLRWHAFHSAAAAALQSASAPDIASLSPHERDVLEAMVP